MIYIQKRIRIIIYISIFSALTAVGAFIKIPLPFVPITLQTLFVLLSGNLLGARYGAISQFIYLGLGLIGFPIFAKGGGLGYVFQPTFGYLLGYPITAYIAGKLLQNTWNKRFLWLCISNFIATLPVLIIGALYLYVNLNYFVAKELPIMKAFWSGLIIFIPGDVLKVLLATLITKRIYKYFIT